MIKMNTFVFFITILLSGCGISEDKDPVGKYTCDNKEDGSLFLYSDGTMKEFSNLTNSEGNWIKLDNGKININGYISAMGASFKMNVDYTFDGKVLDNGKRKCVKQ
jgi:hypothetical protein